MSATFWEHAWINAQPKLESIRQKINTWPYVPPRILRVGQLDAELLDQELVNMLKDPVNKSLGKMRSIFESRFDPEVVLIISALLYKYSVWDHGATYGAKLQDLRYASVWKGEFSARSPSGLPRRALLLHSFLTIVIPYLHARARIYALSGAWPDAPSIDWKRRAWELLVHLETLHSTLSLLSFVGFLYNGRHRTIADRVAGLRLEPTHSIATRNVSYEFMNRQMVWHSFTEFLIFLLPIINTRAMRRRMQRVSNTLRPSNILAMIGFSSTASSSASSPRRGKYWSLPVNECAICAERAAYNISNISADPTTLAYARAQRDQPTAADGNQNDDITPPTYPITNPYITNCGHEYCYFCLSEKMIQLSTANNVEVGDRGWECLRCVGPVTSSERVRGIDEGPSGGSQDGMSEGEESDLEGADEDEDDEVSRNSSVSVSS
ncbi:Pex12 amino terminal region-domain-containing protein [Cantharellus anzutake]|uniref:Pex12 amino terminal region-domain-containing protein n=1 Tax=Cantharellus anzutake TaxID=1750568 RepID=UPI001906D4CB|nr:Pex12 amino terminal region-domain-containing protein [Cantharellus anzutake]KAF8341636.1 Pex12 amino terminal region-domain-containing protein [Cantharellus anzutake]